MILLGWILGVIVASWARVVTVLLFIPVIQVCRRDVCREIVIVALIKVLILELVGKLTPVGRWTEAVVLPPGPTEVVSAVVDVQRPLVVSGQDDKGDLELVLLVEKLFVEPVLQEVLEVRLLPPDVVQVQLVVVLNHHLVSPEAGVHDLAVLLDQIDDVEVQLESVAFEDLDVVESDELQDLDYLVLEVPWE